MSVQEVLSIEVIDDSGTVSLVEMLSVAHAEREAVIAMVDAGLLEPRGNAVDQWQFASRDLRRLRAARRLMDDLGVNLSGVAVILDLIEERNALHGRLAALERWTGVP